MKNKLLIFFCLLLSLSLSAQELNCNVQLNSDQVQGSNKQVFTTLQKSISEFLNGRKWTDLTFASNERIECTFNITVKKVEMETYTAEIMVQSRRPIFNSNYNSPLLNYKDLNFTFDYKEFDQLEMNQNTITSNLTAVLAYYAYIVIGFDLDSYSRLGGTPYFQAAENIVTSAQSTDWKGWKAFESSKNRYTLVNNLTDEAFKKFRNYFYEYHRLGLDEMSSNSTNGRAKITEGLPLLREANRARPSASLIPSFLDAKNDELVNIFSKGSSTEKTMFVEILSDINPSQSARYEKVMKM